jgi:hypothetical protein
VRKHVVVAERLLRQGNLALCGIVAQLPDEHAAAAVLRPDGGLHPEVCAEHRRALSAVD